MELRRGCNLFYSKLTSIRSVMNERDLKRTKCAPENVAQILGVASRRRLLGFQDDTELAYVPPNRRDILLLIRLPLISFTYAIGRFQRGDNLKNDPSKKYRPNTCLGSLRSQLLFLSPLISLWFGKSIIKANFIYRMVLLKKEKA